ncbi:MAG TPA: VOC family protein [Methylomirabilota bacterium]|nr:VOC family protein [Methylomirabilota bacterium]
MPDPGSITHLDHLVLNVRDVGATAEFYHRALGMDVVTFGYGRIALRFGDQKINLHHAGHEVHPRAGNPVPGSADFCLVTREPVRHWIEHLTEIGVAIEEGPVRRAGARHPLDSIYIRDPDGNLVEIANEIVPPEEEEPFDVASDLV